MAYVTCENVGPCHLVLAVKEFVKRSGQIGPHERGKGARGVVDLSQKRILERPVAADAVKEKDVSDVDRRRRVLNALPELALFLVDDFPDVIHHHFDGPSQPRIHFRAVFLQ